jgi:hypothetical protein
VKENGKTRTLTATILYATIVPRSMQTSKDKDHRSAKNQAHYGNLNNDHYRHATTNRSSGIAF